MHIEIRGAERLSFRERQVVVLRESGYGNHEVARRLGISAGTVATLFNRARRKGYQVVIVLDGDPLALYDEGGVDDVPPADAEEDEESAGEDGREEEDEGRA